MAGACPRPACTGHIQWRPWAGAGDEPSHFAPLHAGQCDTCGVWAAQCPVCGDLVMLHANALECACECCLLVQQAGSPSIERKITEIVVITPDDHRHTYRRQRD